MKALELRVSELLKMNVLKNAKVAGTVRVLLGCFTKALEALDEQYEVGRRDLLWDIQKIY